MGATEELYSVVFLAPMEVLCYGDKWMSGSGVLGRVRDLGMILLEMALKPMELDGPWEEEMVREESGARTSP